MVEEADEIGVVHHVRRGSEFVRRGDARIRNDSGHQFLQPRIPDRSRVFQKLSVELADVFFGVGKKVSQVDLLRLCNPELLKRKLRLVAVNLDASAYLDEIVAADALSRRVELIPHARFDGAAALATLKPQRSPPPV